MSITPCGSAQLLAFGLAEIGLGFLLPGLVGLGVLVWWDERESGRKGG